MEIFYLPPSEFWYLTAARLAVSFDDTKKGSGTGFFLYDGIQYFLVTARHVVDPKYLPKAKKRDAICIEMEVAFQSAVNPGTSRADIGYQRLRITEPDFCYPDDGMDLAALAISTDFLPILQNGDEIRPCTFSMEYLATADELAKRYAGEPVIFVGFPSNSPVNQVADAEFHYPILRQGVFAFPPVHGIEVNDQLGKNYGLMDSFAQSGFSGGPIISLQKGWADGSWHPAADYRAPKLVGLVCGHYRSSEDRSDGVHSGLSFFARSNSIRDLIDRMCGQR